MVNGETLGAAIIDWAGREPSVVALVMIGSQVRAGERGKFAADQHSDWDFQVVTTDPARFAQGEWLSGLGHGAPLAYVARIGRLGSAMKVSAVMPDGELDLVIIPERELRMIRRLVAFGPAGRKAAMRRGLGDLAIVIRAGHRLLKGEAEWGEFFRRVATETRAPRLDDAAVRAMAEGFLCDFVSTQRKIARGELLAAQRWLHVQLAETNFRLAHELRQRRDQPSLPDARRLETLGVNTEPLAINAVPTAESLKAAVEKTAATLRDLLHELLGDTWHWPL
jgi:hypothetical protein